MRKTLRSGLLVLSLIALSFGCSACSTKTENSDTDVTLDSSSLSSDETLSADVEKVINHSVFTDYDEKKKVADEIGDDFNYAYNWDLDYGGDDELEYAFIDYLYYMAGAYPVYAELLGGEVVNSRYAVWEGNGYNIGTIVAEDGAMADIYIKFTDSTLKEKLDKLNEEKNKQSKEIADKRNNKYKEFSERISSLGNLDSIPIMIKNYPLYADCIVSYGSSNGDEGEQEYSTKTLDEDRLEGLIDLLLESTYTNIEQSEIDEKVTEENVKALLAFELLNDCNMEELVNNPTNLGYVVYFKDGSVNYYLDTISSDGEYITCIVDNDKFDEYLSPIYDEMVKEALKNKEDIESIESVEDVESAEDIGSVEDTEDFESMESTENNVEGVENESTEE